MADVRLATGYGELKQAHVFDVPAIAQFYFTTDADYMQMKAYIRMLDYLRLLILEYLRSYQGSQKESG
jgi:hypothetical protein